MLNDREWVRKALRHEEQEAHPLQLLRHAAGSAEAGNVLPDERLRGDFGVPHPHDGAQDDQAALCRPVARRSAVGRRVRRRLDYEHRGPRRARGAVAARARSEPLCLPRPYGGLSLRGRGAWCEKNRDHFTIIWVGDLWERATFMRGMQEVLVDVAFHPAFVEELLQGVGEWILGDSADPFRPFRVRGHRRERRLRLPDALMIPPAWRRLIKPRLAEIYALAKRHGRTVFHHTCGNVRPIIGDMLDIGLDILHPIQPEANDIRWSNRQFGRDVTLCGGIRTQDLMPRGTQRPFAPKSANCGKVMGNGGGYLLEPGITLQGDCPIENLVTMIEEMRSQQ